MKLEAADQVDFKAGGSMYAQAAGGTMNIKASGNIKETGSAIHLNTSTQAAGDAASAGSASPTAADSAAIAAVGKPAYIAETMTLLVTDIPNPIASDPPLIEADSHGLALNVNDPVTAGSGIGGENIRNLQDLIANLDVAHTFKPSVDVGAQVNLSGVPTTTSAGIWDGYSDELQKDQYILGKRAFSNIRRFHGWVEDGDVASSKQVTWNCTIDSTRP